MNFLENRGEVAVEMVKISNQLDETNVDEGVSTTHYAAVDLLLNRRRAEFVG